MLKFLSWVKAMQRPFILWEKWFGYLQLLYYFLVFTCLRLDRILIWLKILSCKTPWFHVCWERLPMQFTRIPSFIRLGTLPRAVCASIARQWWKQCWRDWSFSPNQRIGKSYSGRIGQGVKLLRENLIPFSKNEKRPNVKSVKREPFGETHFETPKHKKSELTSDVMLMTQQ